MQALDMDEYIYNCIILNIVKLNYLGHLPCFNFAGNLGNNEVFILPKV